MSVSVSMTPYEEHLLTLAIKRKHDECGDRDSLLWDGVTKSKDEHHVSSARKLQPLDSPFACRLGASFVFII